MSLGPSVPRASPLPWALRPWQLEQLSVKRSLPRAIWSAEAVVDSCA